MTEPSDKLAALALGLSDEAHYRKHWAVAELMHAAELLLVNMLDEVKSKRDNAITEKEENEQAVEVEEIEVFRGKLKSLRKLIPFGVS